MLVRLVDKNDWHDDFHHLINLVLFLGNSALVYVILCGRSKAIFLARLVTGDMGTSSIFSHYHVLPQSPPNILNFARLSLRNSLVLLRIVFLLLYCTHRRLRWYGLDSQTSYALFLLSPTHIANADHMLGLVASG